MVTRAYSYLTRVCTDAPLQNFEALHDVSQRLSSKLRRYKIHLCSPVANLARVLDPRFSNNILRNNGILRGQCTFHDDTSIDVTETTYETNRSSIIDKFIDENSRGYASSVIDFEVIRFLSSTTVGDKKSWTPALVAPEQEKISKLI